MVTRYLKATEEKQQCHTRKNIPNRTQLWCWNFLVEGGEAELSWVLIPLDKTAQQENPQIKPNKISKTTHIQTQIYKRLEKTQQQCDSSEVSEHSTTAFLDTDIRKTLHEALLAKILVTSNDQAHEFSLKSRKKSQ